jgi:hypothetical protein
LAIGHILDDRYLLGKASPHDPMEHRTIGVEQPADIVPPSPDADGAASASGL